MAQRTQLIAELASNHGGTWSLCADMIRAAADSGADWVKLQLYDAGTLRDNDAQKTWLTQAQVTPTALDDMIGVAQDAGIGLTASVFGIPQVTMAFNAGLRVIKLGSGETGRIQLANAAIVDVPFEEVWVSEGLQRAPWSMIGVPRLPRLFCFYGISQYPTPYLRGYSRLLQIIRAAPWGWSDHGQTTQVAQHAIEHGAAYLERHFSLGEGRGCRWQPWDTDPKTFRALRDYAEACAWEGTKEHAEACQKYLGRWGD